MAQFLPVLLQAALAAGGGILGREKGKPLTTEQKRQNELAKLIIDAVTGKGGPFADLVNLDEEAFQRSVVDPSLQRFESQIAPDIQQNFIASRLQRGTGLNDALARAGVDLQSQIDQSYLDFLNKGDDRMIALLGAALGFNPFSPTPAQSILEAAGQGLSGFGSKFDFQKLFNQGGGGGSPQAPINSQQGTGFREGFTA